jgi:cellulose 1,4-beta-cellobiosidase
MKKFTRATAMLTVAGVLTMTHAAFAADPTQADFDACNREAQGTGAPAASPGSTGSTGGSMSGTSTGTTTGTTGGAQSSSSGSVSSQSPSSSGSMSSASPSMSTPGSTSSSTSSGGASASVSGDAQLKGIASAGLSDPAYQQAYRDCMKRRGF